MTDQTTIVPLQQPERLAWEGWMTDAEIIRLLRAPPKVSRQAMRMLDMQRTSGFPQKNKLWGNRRWGPAVQDYFAKTNGLKMDASQQERRTHVR